MRASGRSRASFQEPLIFERGSPGRKGVSLPPIQRPSEQWLPEELVRPEVEGFPELSELDVVRHFTRLSQYNFSIDTNFYPLGSCTMKYNPRINESVARMTGFADLHPLVPTELAQGALRLLFEIEQWLAEMSGMDAVTLQPSAGAQGELCGIMSIRQRLASKGNPRTKVLVPDTAHGTNPASSAMCGYEVCEVKSNARGIIEAKEVDKLMDHTVAALMMTNPNTLGLFETELSEIAQIIHSRGGFLYLDGANFNALMGVSKPGLAGVDVIQFNLHKTFSTPHGGGGPGAGPVGVKKELIPYLPRPRIVQDTDGYRWETDNPESLGRLRCFYGNFGVLVRAYTYILSLGKWGLEEVTRMAILNANYLKAKLKSHYHLPYPYPCMHEFVLSDREQTPLGVHTIDVAKRLIDFGFHPPTVYFPLVVSGAIMIEPTETESKETLDEFAEAMAQIAQEARENPRELLNSPLTTPTARLDEVSAARKPILRWKPNDGSTSRNSLTPQHGQK
jgi:glycine dehydrogenase subunit 2